MTKRTFEQWMLLVDTLITERCGLSAYDLPDQCYRLWYDEGVSPKTAASRAMRYAETC
jgi:hypothetical protein